MVSTSGRVRLGQPASRVLSCVLWWALLMTQQALGGPQDAADRPGSRTQTGQTVTELADGSWLLIGGESNGIPQARAQIYDPATGRTNTLATRLSEARAWHTATILPDGRVIVFGGVGIQGRDLNTAEIYDPVTQSFSALQAPDLAARSRHTATLLPDGQVLLTGGSAPTAQIWDSSTNSTTEVEGTAGVGRLDAYARLDPSGAVQINGGVNGYGAPVSGGALYLPAENRFQQSAAPFASRAAAVPTIVASIPAEASRDVAVSTRIAVQFNTALDEASVSAADVTLVGPGGAIAVQVVPAERGVLLFVNPLQELLPASDYTLFIRGAVSRSQTPMPLSHVSFSTAALAPTQASPLTAQHAIQQLSLQSKMSAVPAAQPQVWVPPSRGPWVLGRAADQEAASRALPQAPAGATALAGRVLLQSGAPLARVSVWSGSARTTTDAYGQFLLSPLIAGRVQVVIDGRTASSSSVQYGQFVVGVDIHGGETNTLGYTVWMPVIDTAHAVDIASPTSSDVTITSPLLPGVRLTIPAGTIIREPNGKIATSVSLTPVPLDRPPFPTPAFALYFVVQPGGAVLESLHGDSKAAARIVYPNVRHRPPGSLSRFMYYDPYGAGWTSYGHGRVSKSGRRIDPDHDVHLHGFSAFGDAEAANPPPPVNPPPKGCGGGGGSKGGSGGSSSESGGTEGDPVDCSTGLFVYDHVDLQIADTIPIVIRRTYQSSDATPRNFGVGFSLGDYAMWLYSAAGPMDVDFTTLDLVSPDGSLTSFTRTAQSAPTGLTGLQMTATDARSPFYGSTITYDDQMYLILTTKQGFQYRFYAADGRFLRSITDRNGHTLQVVPALPDINEENYPIVKIISPSGRWVQLQYGSQDPLEYPNGTSMITQITDNTGRAVKYAYDSFNRLTAVTYPDGGIEQYTYDGDSNRIASVIAPNGQTRIVNTYDGNDRLSVQTLADGGIYQFSYTLGGDGSVTQTDVTDPRGFIHRMAFNGNGYVTASTRALGTSVEATTTYQLDSSTNAILSQTDPLGRTTQFSYDGMGNVTAVTFLYGTPAAATYSYTYTPQFNLPASATDPLGQQTLFSYDSFGNLTSVADPLGHTTTITYGSTGMPATVTDALNHTTTMTYSGSDLVGVTDAVGRMTGRYVDALGRTAGVLDPAGAVTRFTYDSMGRKTQTLDPLNGTTTMTYDLDGNLTKIANARSGATSFTYDGMDRRRTRQDALGQQDSFTFDLGGNQTLHLDRKGQKENRTFDALNRPTHVEYDTSTGAVESTIDYSYDAGGRVTQIADSAGGTLTKTFDGMDRTLSESGPGGTLTYQYDAAGRRTQMSVSGQASVVTYGYDAASRLMSITQGGSAVAISYDTADRRSSLTLPNGLVLSYSYDNSNAVTGMSYSLAGTSVAGLSYSYDSAGRVASRSGTLDTLLTPAQVGASSYDAGNRLTQWGATTLVYDANGNLTSDGTYTYTWNARNQLVGLTGPHAGSFAYDGRGRRTGVSIDGVSRTLLYDGNNLVQELQGLSYVNYLTGTLIDETFTRTDNSGSWTFLRDMSGTVAALADNAAVIQTAYTYDPYGNVSTGGAANGNPLQFTGRDNDGTGLYFYRARYFSAGLGRFISADPLGLTSGPNEYAYVQGDPIGYIDPLGLYCLTESQINGIAGAAGGALAGGAAMAEFGPVGIAIGAVVGGFTGGVLGQFSSKTFGNETGLGAAAAGTSSGAAPVSGMVGGAVGGAVTWGAQQAGLPDSVAVPLGSGLGGAAGGAVAPLLDGAAAGAAEGGAIGAAAGAVAAAVAAGLSAGNDCPCGK